jgi:hypothetical protein
VPAGVGDGTTLRLEGQGMPYYAGGPAGPLVLTVAIPAQASPLPLPQDSTEPTVAVSTPNAELPSVEDLRVPPARPEAPGELEPTVPASDESETAPTVLAADATSLPTEVATPAHHTPFPVKPLRGYGPYPVKPAKPGASRRFGLLALAAALLALVLVVVVLVSYRLVVTQSGPGSSGASTPVVGTTPSSSSTTPNGSSSSPPLSISPTTLTGSEGGDTSTCTGYFTNYKWECKVTLQNTSSVGVNWSAKAPNGTTVTFPAGANGYLNPNEQHQLYIVFPYDACAQAPFAITIAVQNGPSYTVTWNCS